MSNVQFLPEVVNDVNDALAKVYSHVSRHDFSQRQLFTYWPAEFGLEVLVEYMRRRNFRVTNIPDNGLQVGLLVNITPTTQ
jgi:hypothetical protein